MSEYLLILKMIAAQEPASDYYEPFPGSLERITCPVCRKIISMAKLAVAEAEKLEAKSAGAAEELTGRIKSKKTRR